MAAATSTLLNILAVPNAAKTQVAGRVGEAVKIRVRAVPEGGRANAALCEYLAESLGVGRRAVRLESGDTGRQKRIRIDGLTEDEVCRRLGL